MKKVVYFVRHGQSEGNIGNVFQSVESPLSEVGLKQAEYIANRVSNISFERLIASPVMRAKQTAEIISKKTGKLIEFSDLFVERIKPSNLSGKPHSDEQANKLNDEWSRSLFNSNYKAENGENFDEIIKRADLALKYLENLKEEKILVVTHGFFLKVLISSVLFGESITGKELGRFVLRAGMANTGLTVLAFDDKLEDPSWRLLTWNDKAHLGEF